MDADAVGRIDVTWLCVSFQAVPVAGAACPLAQVRGLAHEAAWTSQALVPLD